MPFLTTLLATAAVAGMRPEGDPPEAKSAPPRAPAIVVEGPAAPRWTIQPDPRLSRRYGPPPDRQQRGFVIRF